MREKCEQCCGEVAQGVWGVGVQGAKREQWGWPKHGRAPPGGWLGSLWIQGARPGQPQVLRVGAASCRARLGSKRGRLLGQI